MIGDYDIGTLADRTVLTPAERALLVEQAQTAEIELRQFIHHCVDGTAGDAIRSYVPFIRAVDYMNNIINTKVAEAVHHEHGEG